MIRLLTSVTGVFWLIGSLLFFIHTALVSHKMIDNNFILFTSGSLFLLGITPVLLAMLLFYRTKMYKQKIQKIFKNMTIDQMQDVLSKTKKYDFMDNDGAIKNWKGVIFFLKLGIPKYVIIKDVIDEIQTNLVLKETYSYYEF